MLMLLLAAGTMTNPTKVFPYEVHSTRLENGLTVMAVPTEHKGLVAFYTVVRTGSRNEVEPGKSGFAHFFEHMMFRGTERFSQDQYNEVLKGLGADSNAFTTDDWTCYHMVAAASALETMFDIESDRFQNLKYEEPEFQKEARAVLGEYNKSASSPFLILEEKLLDAAYTTHTYKHTTIGFLKDIEDMPNQFEYSRVFFDRWYRPENCVVFAVGDVNPEKVFELGKKYYGAWKKPPAEPVVISKEPPQTEEKRVDLSWPSKTLPYLYFGYHAPAYDPESRDGRALDALSELLFSSSAALYQKLVLEEQAVDMLQGGLQDHRDPYLFTVIARIKDETKIAWVLEEIEKAIAGIATTPPAAERVEAVKSNMRYSFLRRLSSPDGIARALGDALQLTGDPSAMDRSFATLQTLTPADIQRVAAKYFSKNSRTVVTLRGPASKGASLQ